MASKRKPKISRNNNWVQLKSHLWGEFKDGAYDWNSKAFNKIVSETYQQIDKKDYRKVAHVDAIARGLEDQILKESIAQTYQIPYYEIGRTLEAFKDDPTYKGYKVVTKFNTPEFKDEKFDAEAFEYEGSQFQQLVNDTDDERMIAPIKSPPHKINVEVIPEKKLIKMYVGQPSPEEKVNKTTKAFKQIKSTAASTSAMKNKLKDNKERIKQLNSDLRLEKDFIIPLIGGTSQLNIDLMELSSENIKNWSREVKKLTKENEEIEKQLAKQGKGFSTKRKGKGKRK